MKKLDFKKNKKNIIIAISLVLFLIVTVLLFNNIITNIDLGVSSYVTGIRTSNLTSIFMLVTNICGAYSLVAISILLLIIIKKKRIPLYIILNLLLCFLTSQVFKFIFRRPRPDGINLIDAAGYSYPSGHSMVSMAYFGFVAYLLYKNIHHRIYKLIFLIIFSILIFAIGFSRIYLGVHYLSDVVGGFLLSIAYLLIFIQTIKLEDI